MCYQNHLLAKKPHCGAATSESSVFDQSADIFRRCVEDFVSWIKSKLNQAQHEAAREI